MGRTGTYIAVDWLMQEARCCKEIDVLSVVLRMRECRISMVQTEVGFVAQAQDHFFRIQN